MLVSCLTYSPTLKMEATFSSKTSVDFQRTTRRYIPEDSTLHDQSCENLKSHEAYVCPLTKNIITHLFLIFIYIFPLIRNFLLKIRNLSISKMKKNKREQKLPHSNKHHRHILHKRDNF
jgi:hypothetical protein